MRDITNDIKKAIETNVLWSIDQFYLFLEVAEENNFGISYWDDEINWATLLSDDVMIGYVYLKFPFALLSKEHQGNLKNVLNKFKYLVSVFVTDLTSNELLINDDPILVERFGYLEYNQPVSASDIWFCTIT
ncbi:hypothetical protein SAMN05428975_2511 [Mucilaginibacter sp. OK268]|uniref:hypothetical protein n=1 Tax=Mucilaginibacter sp. OK268 TaxID=1881048 RepID=UPI00087EA8EF|nr:hypothetical protein [Mucilaginibacter sp. OK268]SDP75197.1 hypothetical protein SAMN05428975_2511 [Mucilaginibacter sp. OK268]